MTKDFGANNDLDWKDGEVKIYWVIVNGITGIPIPPQDCNPGHHEGMLVYPDARSADAACVHQKAVYEVDCKPCILGNEKYRIW